MYIGFYKSPIGMLRIKTSSISVLSVEFVDDISNDEFKKNDILEKTILQLDEYFTGIRKEFNVELDLKGTEFQKKVWKELMNIEYGNTKTYKEIAIKINNKNAQRAVGMANNKNPIAIIVPCHRVIGSNKKLVGYASGIDKKEWLLNHEKKFKM